MIDQIWQFIYPNKEAFIIGLIVAAVVTLVFVLFRNIFKKIWELIFQNPEKKRRQDEKLQEHFRDIKEEALAIITPCSSLSEWYGAVLLNQTPETLVSISYYVREFGAALLPVPLPSFVAHFPKEAALLAKYRGMIEEHNKKHVNFVSKLKEYFESRKIPVVNENPISPLCIYSATWRPLFKWWESRCYQRDYIWPNFDEIETKTDTGPNNLFAEGWGSQAIAYAETNYGKKKCKHAIHDVAYNEEYQMYASWLIRLADSLVREVHEFAQQLSNMLDSTEKFWPGTKIYRFTKEKKKCPKCKEIFG